MLAGVDIRMTKLYLRSFVTLKYTVILPVLIVLSFICMMVFINSGIVVFRYLALGFAAVMVVFLIKYIYERNTVGNQLKKIEDWNAYDNAVVIGQAFLLKDRMMVYDRSLVEFSYTDLIGVRGEKLKKGKFKLTFQIPEGSVSDVCSSKEQAGRFAQFLLTRNPSLQITEIIPEGDGKIDHIESGK